MTGGPYRWASAAVHAAQPRLQEWWRAAVLRRGRDVTGWSAAASCLVVAPHPDDETLGCGATIARKRAGGTRVRVVIVADGRHAQRQSARLSPAQLGAIRAAEGRAACAALGVAAEELVQWGYEDTRVAEAVAELVPRLVGEIRRADVDEVLVVSGRDHHPDHRAVNRAVRLALAQLPGLRAVVREYPVWHWADGPWVDLSARPLPRRAGHLLAAPLAGLVGRRADLVATGGHLDAKRAALAAHVSQTANLTGEDDWNVMDEAFLADFLLPAEPFWRVR